MGYVSAQLAIVIPTKNRPDDLLVTIESVLNQSILPKQLIIIDQSAEEDGYRQVSMRCEALPSHIREDFDLLYVRDTAITGGSEARNRGLALVGTKIVLFLDDDVILESDFNERILEAYRERPEAGGVAGIITNPWSNPFALQCWMDTFMVGPFRDDSHPVCLRPPQSTETAPIKVRRLTGCLMSFPVEAIRSVRFDENLAGRCDGEDIDFCVHVWPRHLFIAPRARLIHKRSPVSRFQEGWLARHSRTMWYLYQRNWSTRLRYKLCFFWLNLGYMTIATLASFRWKSIEPWRTLIDSARRGKMIGRASCRRDLTGTSVSGSKF